ncbi:hypothetical protein [Ligilactobacillus ruminis]|nr:hypothetical protein [Ligilactobacillus ruminis]
MVVLFSIRAMALDLPGAFGGRPMSMPGSIKAAVARWSCSA